jgi:hypothetical protein
MSEVNVVNFSKLCCSSKMKGVRGRKKCRLFGFSRHAAVASECSELQTGESRRFVDRFAFANGDGQAFFGVGLDHLCRLAEYWVIELVNVVKLWIREGREKSGFGGAALLLLVNIKKREVHPTFTRVPRTSPWTKVDQPVKPVDAESLNKAELMQTSPIRYITVLAPSSPPRDVHDVHPSRKPRSFSQSSEVLCQA